MSIIEIMLFKLQDSGEIAEQKLLKILLDIYSIKTNAAKSWLSDIEFARMETLNSVIPDTSFLVLLRGYASFAAQTLVIKFKTIPQHV